MLLRRTEHDKQGFFKSWCVRLSVILRSRVQEDAEKRSVTLRTEDVSVVMISKFRTFAA